MAKKRVFSPVLLLQIALGVYFIAFGILGIIDYNSGANQIARAFSVNSNSILFLIMNILVMLGGVVLIGALFSPTKNNLIFATLIFIIVIWIFKIVVSRFIDVNFNSFNEAAWLKWISAFANDIVLLAALWAVARE
ncbi:MAG: hypothetical protein JXR63_09755 [Spirochaetales bacterium]|nr:hypothetical protein [Spirochaetales bacterium]